MRVIVAGGFGFVGGRLAQELHARGHLLVLGSRKARPTPAWLSAAKVVRTIWEDPRSLEVCCQGADVVIHASGLGAPESAADPAAAARVNGEYTRLMVEAAVRAGVPRFFYLSTAHVYSSPLAGRITEETLPTNPHPYATSHVAGEEAVLGARRAGRIDAVVVRLANAFGVPTHADANCWMLLVNDLCRQAVENDLLVLHSGGARRDFVALSQVGATFAEMLELPDFSPLKGAINVGSGHSVSVEYMARLVQERCTTVLGSRPEISTSASVADAGPVLDFATVRPLGRPAEPESTWRVEVDALLDFCRTAFAGGTPLLDGGR